jgi:hypothetical protein
MLMEQCWCLTASLAHRRSPTDGFDLMRDHRIGAHGISQDPGKPKKPSKTLFLRCYQKIKLETDDNC